MRLHARFTARQRVLTGPRAACKAGPRRKMRLHARHTPVDGTAACLARLLRQGRHAVAGAWAEESLGGLKSWQTSHDATPRSPNTAAGAWAEELLGGSKSWPAYHEAILRLLNAFGRRGSFQPWCRLMAVPEWPAWPCPKGSSCFGADHVTDHVRAHVTDHARARSCPCPAWSAWPALGLKSPWAV